ncbi:hypothetical protein NFI96_002116 [Prochilodus magdalenae]|nr:hypothetical protein NFI96_002116 [Prochilodus magdalenae]
MRGADPGYFYGAPPVNFLGHVCPRWTMFVWKVSQF